VLGLVFTVYYINSFTSALQRAYIRAWRRPPSSLVYGYALGATWLVGILAYFTLIGGMPGAVPSLGAPLRAPTLSNAIGIGPEAGTEPGPTPAEPKAGS
jgi:uncharacterized BrkB/YihY/UPF0761 family membrane protein